MVVVYFHKHCQCLSSACSGQVCVDIFEGASLALTVIAAVCV